MDYRHSHIQKGGEYDDALDANPWDAYMHRVEASFLSETVPRLFSDEPRYLDFACGTGRITSVVAPMAAQVTGVDVSESMLAEARKKIPGGAFVFADLTRESPDLGLFDLVTSFRFFGNAQPELRMAAVAALNRHQPTGGYLIVNNHRNPISLANLSGRLRGSTVEVDLTHGLLRRLLNSGGYEIVMVRPVGVWPFRAKLESLGDTNPVLAEKLERLCHARFLAPIAPDAVVVARKVRDGSHSL
jgi:SAM-dependent methyltransferase